METTTMTTEPGRRHYRIAHLADTHLGYRAITERRTPDTNRNQRAEDTRAAFGQAIGEIVNTHLTTAGGIDLVVHAGDIFDHPTPRVEDQIAVISAMRTLQALKIPQVWIAGNHEITISRHTVFDLLRSIYPGGDVGIHTNPTPETTMLDSGIQIDTYPHGAARWLASETDRPHRDPRARLRIAVGHGEITHVGRFVQGEYAGDLGEVYDLVALGHIHEYSNRLTAAGPAVMSGPTERYGWRDQHATTGWVLHDFTLEDGRKPKAWTVRSEYRPIATRPLIDLGTIGGLIGDTPATVERELHRRIVARAEDIPDAGGFGAAAAIWRVNIEGIAAEQANGWRRVLGHSFRDLVWYLQIDITTPETTWRAYDYATDNQNGPLDLAAMFEFFVSEEAPNWADGFADRFRETGGAALGQAIAQSRETAGDE